MHNAFTGAGDSLLDQHFHIPFPVSDGPQQHGQADPGGAGDPARSDGLRQGADIDADNLSVAVSRSASRSRRAQASAPRDSVGGDERKSQLADTPPTKRQKTGA